MFQILLKLIYPNDYVKNQYNYFFAHKKGNVFGLEVSGNTGNVSFIHTELGDRANALITGGTFGPEGGLAVTIVTVIALVAVVIIFRNHKKKQRM